MRFWINLFVKQEPNKKDAKGKKLREEKKQHRGEGIAGVRNQ